MHTSRPGTPRPGERASRANDQGNALSDSSEPRAVPPVVAFLSDYGHVDEFVGVCKAVIASIAPEAVVIDIAHDLRPHDVSAAALTLVRAVQYLPKGALVLAVVDPGVGTDRRLVAVSCDEATLFGPD